MDLGRVTKVSSSTRISRSMCSVSKIYLGSDGQHRDGQGIDPYHEYRALYGPPPAGNGVDFGQSGSSLHAVICFECVYRQECCKSKEGMGEWFPSVLSVVLARHNPKLSKDHLRIETKRNGLPNT
jgi:hypothetical protein